ncbi:MAG: tetratricopeptide repeat protein [Nitrospiraceae bacterium]|nr:tetratricopeptide repeat protein [Nitrospiraceae bacterium]
MKALSRKQFRLVVAGAIVIAGLLAYANTFTGEFVWDDASSVLLHRNVQDPSKFFQLFREDQHAFGRGQGNFYRPLVSVTFMIDFLLSRPGANEALSPFFFHVTNLGWHVAAALLLFVLLSRLGAPDFVRAAVPLIYVVHPLHTEAVAYISGRADMMSAAFMFAGLVSALWEGSKGRRIAGSLLSGLFFVGGLLSKESMLIYPLLLLLFAFGRPVEGEDRKRVYLGRLLPLGVAAALFAVYGWLRMTVLHFASGSPPDSSFGQRVVETLQSFALYIGLLFMPTGLHMERSLAGATILTTLTGAVLLFLLIAVMAVSFRKGQTRAGLGLAWFLLTWMPISGIFPLNAPMAEHWMYVPMAGFFWALAELAWAAARQRAARRMVVAAAYAACVCFLALTVARNRAWHDNETLFTATLAENPKSSRVHYNLAVTYEDLTGNLPGARRHYEAVIALHKEKKKALRQSGPEVFWDEELESYLSLGRLHLKRKDYGTAAQQFATVVNAATDTKHRGMRATAAMGLGKCWLAFGDTRKAAELFQQAVAVRPELKTEVQRVLQQGLL